MQIQITEDAYKTAKIRYGLVTRRRTFLSFLYHDNMDVTVRAALLTLCPDMDAVRLIEKNINKDSDYGDSKIAKDLATARINLRPFTYNPDAVCTPGYAQLMADYGEIWLYYKSEHNSYNEKNETLLSRIYSGRYNNYTDFAPVEKVIRNAQFVINNSMTLCKMEKKYIESLQTGSRKLYLALTFSMWFKNSENADIYYEGFMDHLERFPRYTPNIMINFYNNMPKYLQEPEESEMAEIQINLDTFNYAAYSLED